MPTINILHKQCDSLHCLFFIFVKNTMQKKKLFSHHLYSYHRQLKKHLRSFATSGDLNDYFECRKQLSEIENVILSENLPNIQEAVYN